MPGNNGQMPVMPGTDGTAPQNDGQQPEMPDNNGQMPVMPGTDGTAPQNDGQQPEMPGNNGRMPVMPGTDGTTQQNDGQQPPEQQGNTGRTHMAGNRQGKQESQRQAPEGHPGREQGDRSEMKVFRDMERAGVISRETCQKILEYLQGSKSEQPEAAEATDSDTSEETMLDRLLEAEIITQEEYDAMTQYAEAPAAETLNT